MSDFDQYGGRMFGRAEFWQRWNGARQTPHDRFAVDKTLAAGDSLVQAL